MPTHIPSKIRPNVFDIAVDYKGPLEVSAIILDRGSEYRTWEHKNFLAGSDRFPFIFFFSSFPTDQMKIL